MIKIILEFIANNYISLVMLIMLAVLILTDKDDKPPGMEWIWMLVCSTMILIVITGVQKYVYQVLESPHDGMNVTPFINFQYFKTFLEHILFCSIAFMEANLIANTRHKIVLYIPEIITLVFETMSFCRIPIVFYFDNNGNWHGGPLSHISYITSVIYMIWIMVYSIKLIKDKDKNKAFVVMMISIFTLIACWLEIKDMARGVMINMLIIDIMIYYYYFYGVYKMEIRQKLYEREHELEQTQVNLLLSQIKPHFIYNTLASIRYLCTEDSDKAVEMLDNLSNYLRKSTDIMTKKQIISFKNELQLVDNYLYIMNVRFGDKIEIRKNIEAEDFCIPFLTLQPLIENAINHGLKKKSENGIITISSVEDETEFLVIVEDNGVGFDVDKEFSDGSEHVGIYNVEKRLRLISKGELKIESEKGIGTKVTVVIPKSE